MKKITILLILALCQVTTTCWSQTVKSLEAGESDFAADNDEKKPTTVLIVRHAEKAKSPEDNPPLTHEGEKRAMTLAHMLNQSGVSAVFSTNTTRTVETVNNFARRKNIRIQFYETIEDVTRIIQSDYRGKTVLVAGHSNTVPGMIQAFGIDSPPNIDNEYNNLFILTRTMDGMVSMIRLKFEIYRDMPE